MTRQADQRTLVRRQGLIHVQSRGAVHRVGLAGIDVVIPQCTCRWTRVVGRMAEHTHLPSAPKECIRTRRLRREVVLTCADTRCGGKYLQQQAYE